MGRRIFGLRVGLAISFANWAPIQDQLPALLCPKPPLHDYANLRQGNGGNLASNLGNYNAAMG